MQKMSNRVGLLTFVFICCYPAFSKAQETSTEKAPKTQANNEETNPEQPESAPETKTDKKSTVVESAANDNKDTQKPEESTTPPQNESQGTDETKGVETSDKTTDAPEKGPEPQPSEPPQEIQQTGPSDAAGTNGSTPEGVVAKSPVVTIKPKDQSPKEPLDTPEKKPADGSKYLKGTWTKSIMFSTDDGLFQFQPRGWVQPMLKFHAVQDIDNDGQAITNTGFGLQRGRFGFQAFMFNWAHIYLDTGYKSGKGKLVDFFIDVGPDNGKGAFAVRVGYFRPYYCRQLLMATTKLGMIDYARAWSDPYLGLDLGRDVGAAIYGFALNGLEYGVGLWNGNMNFNDTTDNDPHDAIIKKDGDTDLQVGGRIAVHPLSMAGTGNPVKLGEEADSAMSTKPGLVIGASLMFEKQSMQSQEDSFNFNQGIFQPQSDDTDKTLLYNGKHLRFGADLAFKYRGFSLHAELFLIKRWADSDTQTERIFKQEFERRYLDEPGIGSYAQIGFFMVPKEIELVLRFDAVDENVYIRGLRFFPTLGLSYYIFGHNLKLQAQYRANVSTGYVRAYDKEPRIGETAGFTPLSHDIMLMLQFSI